MPPASLNWVIIDLDNGLSPLHAKPLNKPMMTPHQSTTREPTKLHFKISFVILLPFWQGKTSWPIQITKFMGPTWGPPGSCRPQMGPCWPHEPCYQGTDACRCTWWVYNRARIRHKLFKLEYIMFMAQWNLKLAEARWRPMASWILFITALGGGYHLFGVKPIFNIFIQ